MANESSYYEKLLFVFRNAAAFLPLIMLVFGLFARQGYADDRYYQGDLMLAGLVAAATLTASAIYWYTTKNRPSRLFEATANLAIHILTIMFVLYVSGFLSAFLAVWIILMVSSHITFGRKGFLISLAALCLNAGLMLYIYPNTVSGEQLEILQGVLVVVAISYVVIRIRAITERERSRLAESREQEVYQRERLMALVNSMGDAVISTDDNGVIKLYNSSLLSLLDTNLDLTGKSIDDILALKDKDGQRVLLVEEAKKAHSILTRSDLIHYFSDNDLVKLYINAAPIQPSFRSRAESGFIFILRDITKEKSLEEERDEFISVVSHELRTPVTIAEGNLSNIMLMLERADPQALKKAAGDAHEQIVYLAKLVNDLGTLARAERGTAGSPEPIDLAAMIQELYTTYEPEAKAKKLALNVDVAPELGEVTLNKLYLQEVMQNLVTNSIKYTQKGTITIRGTRTKDWVAISVADTGIGISQSDQRHIFEKFYRSEDYRTRQSSGTGLGLYVCRKLAEKMGLKIECVSRLNHGSTFTIIVPNDLKAPEQPAAAAN